MPYKDDYQMEYTSDSKVGKKFINKETGVGYKCLSSVIDSNGITYTLIPVLNIVVTKKELETKFEEG